MGENWRDSASGLMCVGLAAGSLDDRTRALLDAGVAGVFLSKGAIGDAESMAGLCHHIKSYAGRPLFVAVDHEIASQHHEGAGFSRMPTASTLGGRGEVELARNVGQIIGRELRAVGVDLTFGPVVDVATHDAESKADNRTISGDAETVSELASALIYGQQSEGVAACIKHFPGHGDVELDSGGGLPRLPHGVARLEDVELPPFRAGIGAQVAGMMVGHILYEALDDKCPASLSRAIIFGLLRQKLSYRGMVFTDDVDMGALTDQFSRDQIAALGVASGADCFLCASRPESAFDLIDAIERGVNQGQILPERIKAARRRIAPLFHRYFHDPGPSPDLSAVQGLRESDICAGGALASPKAPQL